MVEPTSLKFECHPLKARSRHLFRPVVNWTVAILSFTAVAIGFRLLLPPLFAFLACLAAIAFWYYVLFYIAYYRSFSIRCPNDKCFKLIDSDTPWVCTGCKGTNTHVEKFPFIHKCEHCGNKPKAYKCHHCREMIFLTTDRQALNHAICLNVRNPPSPDETADRRHDRKIKEKTRELTLEEFEGKIEALKRTREGPKVKSLQERIVEKMDTRVAAAVSGVVHKKKLKEEAKVKYKDDEDMLDMVNKAIDAAFEEEGLL